VVPLTTVAPRNDFYHETYPLFPRFGSASAEINSLTMATHKFQLKQQTLTHCSLVRSHAAAAIREHQAGGSSVFPQKKMIMFNVSSKKDAFKF
jgi:hypothetical protein